MRRQNPNRMSLLLAASLLLAFIPAFAAPALSSTPIDAALAEDALSSWTEPEHGGDDRLLPETDGGPDGRSNSGSLDAFTATGDTVTIWGSGFGHGIGMSQYGSLERANSGQTYDQILSAYFAGTTLQTDTPSPSYWVNLLQEAEKVQLTVRALQPGDVAAEVTRGAESVTVTADQWVEIEHILPYVEGGDRVCVVRTSTGVAWNEGSCHIDITWDGWSPSPIGAIEVSRVWFWDSPGTGEACQFTVGGTTRNCTYARGTLHIRPDNILGEPFYTGYPDDTGFHLVVEIDPESYLLGIAEVPYSWPAETLKVQAVAARSFARFRADARVPELRPWCWCDLYDTSTDQVYKGWGFGTQSWIDAVEGTADEYVKSNGSVAETVYGSSNGGASENNEDIWSGAPVSYLRSTPDPWSVMSSNPYAVWSKDVAGTAFAGALGFDDVTDVSIISTYDSGTPSRIDVTGHVGGSLEVHSFDGVDFDGLFGLRSAHVTSIVGPFTSLDSDFHEVIAVDPSGVITPMAIHGAGTGYAAFAQDGQQTTTMAGVDIAWGGYLGGASDWSVLLYDKQTGRFEFRDVATDGTTSLFWQKSGTSGWSHVVPGDYDGNGVTDLLFYRKTDGLMRFYTIATNGSFVAMTPAMYGTTGWTEMVPGDFDGDGSDDLLWYRATDGLMRFYEIDGTTFVAMTAATYGTRNWGPIPSGDFNGDGSDDLLYYRSLDGLYRFYTLDGAGKFVALGSARYGVPGWDHLQAGNWDDAGGDDLVMVGGGTITSAKYAAGVLSPITIDATLSDGHVIAVVDYDPSK